MAQILVDGDYGLPRIMQFAGPLKDAAATIGAEKTKRPRLYRRFCQVVGTDMMRDPKFVPGETGPDYWCKMMDVALLKAEQDEMNGIGKRGEIFVLIDDVRFMNEVQCLKKWGAVIVFLDADGRLTDLKADWRQHESEALADEYSRGEHDDRLFSFVMTNNRTIEYFHKEIERNKDLFLGGSTETL